MKLFKAARAALWLAAPFVSAGLLSAPAQATQVAPYFYGWAFGDNGYKANWLMTARNNGGVTGATIAFGISGGGCTLSGGLESIMGVGSSDVSSFLNAGGKLILSFGGADGTYLEAVCSQSGMYNLIKSVIDSHGIHAIDFDIEGSQLTQRSLDTVRNGAIKQLQQTYPDLYVSFTLPVAPNGLTSDGINLLKGANSAGVKVSVVNIMTMDYGLPSSTNMGNVAVNSANATFNQLKSIFTGKSDAQLWAMIGITPMIGKNDDAEIFYPSDAQTVADFAKQNGVGLLAYWALERDQTGSGNYNDYSQHNDYDYQYYQTLATANTGGGGGGSADLPNGTYTIVASNSGKCVEVAGAATASGSNVQQNTCSKSKGQIWSVSNMGSGWYRLANPHALKAMDVSSNSTADGANIQIYTNNGTPAQRFAIQRVNGNYFNIVNQTSGKCVDVAGGSTADGANVQQWTCNGNSQQRYQFIPASIAGGAKVPMGRYTVVSLNSGKCLDVAAASTADGANVQQYSCNGTGAQAFDLSVEGKYYHLVNANSGKSVDVLGSGTADGTNVDQWTTYPADNQRFTFTSLGSGEYAIVGKGSGKCIDVAGQSTADSANVDIWTCSGQANQSWSLKPSTY